MPERLHAVILLNPPAVFDLLMKAAKPFIDANTLSKFVTITGSASEVVERLRDHHDFSQSTLEWLEPVLEQRIHRGQIPQLPPLPASSKTLMMPSLRHLYEFATEGDGSEICTKPRDDEQYGDKRHNNSQQSHVIAVQVKVRVSLIFKGEMDHQRDKITHLHRATTIYPQ